MYIQRRMKTEGGRESEESGVSIQVWSGPVGTRKFDSQIS
jgi:hypothetical protein